MQLPTTISSVCIALISIITSCGVAIYDGQFSRVAADDTSSVHSSADVFVSHVQHTHSDYNPSGSMLSNSFQYQSPSVAPRRRSHHKELLRMLEIGSRHAFDDAHLPALT